MGPVEGKGVESMQYDDDKPPTKFIALILIQKCHPGLTME